MQNLQMLPYMSRHPQRHTKQDWPPAWACQRADGLIRLMDSQSGPAASNSSLSLKEACSAAAHHCNFDGPLSQNPSAASHQARQLLSLPRTCSKAMRQVCHKKACIDSLVIPSTVCLLRRLVLYMPPIDAAQQVQPREGAEVL